VTAALVALAFAGAASVGALARVEVIARVNGVRWPFGTVAVNVAGSFLAGLTAAHLHGDARTVVLTAGLGALTTFSTFAVEGRTLWADHAPALSLAYLAGTAGLCVAAASVGLAL
jgi:CrcB protein